jgi:hypothetical protein
MNVEFWNSVFQWGSVALIAITFVFGAGALWTSNRINKRQTGRLVALEKDLTDAKASLAKQQERAANAERQLLELQERARPRTLDPHVRSALIENLRLGGFGDRSIDIEHVAGSAIEPAKFAKELIDTFREAGWKAAITDGFISFGAPPVGLSLRVPDAYGGSEKAFALAGAFESAGLSMPITRDKTMKEAGQVTLVVGLKP